YPSSQVLLASPFNAKHIVNWIERALPCWRGTWSRCIISWMRLRQPAEIIVWLLNEWLGLCDIMKFMSVPGPSLKSRPVDEILSESEAFFMKAGKVHHTLKRLARALEEESIPYAIVGGMALNLLGYTRETVDVDILLTPQGLERFNERLVGK